MFKVSHVNPWTFSQSSVSSKEKISRPAWGENSTWNSSRECAEYLAATNWWCFPRLVDGWCHGLRDFSLTWLGRPVNVDLLFVGWMTSGTEVKSGSYALWKMKAADCFADWDNAKSRWWQSVMSFLFTGIFHYTTFWGPGVFSLIKSMNMALQEKSTIIPASEIYPSSHNHGS